MGTGQISHLRKGGAQAQRISQTVFYWVEDDGYNEISDEEWSAIEHLQRVTNFLGAFHRGELGLIRYSYMPRWPELFEDSMIPERLTPTEVETHVESLLAKGWSWEDLVHARMAARVSGGLFEGECLLAGQSEVSDLPGDVRLVLRFLLKASMIARRCTFRVAIDGPVAVPRLVIREGSMEPDRRGIEEVLKEYRRAGADEAMSQLFDALERGDLLAPLAMKGLDA